MAFTNISLLTHVQVAQDAQSFKIWDESTWNAEEGTVTAAKLQVFFVDDEEVTHQYDDYLLIDGADTTKWDEFLTRDGHVISITDIYESTVSIGSRFIDGYYVIRLIVNDGSYAAGEEPYFDNVQAFLAKYRCMRRKMPATLLSWPMSDTVVRKNWDIYLMGMYLDAAENAVDFGKKVQFRSFIAMIRAMFEHYEIEECW